MTATVNDDVLLADTIDAGDFKISANGVLSFMSPPNYEAPRANGQQR